MHAPPLPRLVRVVEPASEAAPRKPVAIEAPAAAASPLMAYVFTQSSLPLSLERVLLNARAAWPSMPPMQMHGDRDGASVIAGVDGIVLGQTMLVASMYPIGELQEAAGSALGWPMVSVDLNTHTAHVILSVTYADPARAHMILTALTIATLENIDGSGVYWANTDNLISAQAFLENARLKDAPPAMLWTKINLAQSTTAHGLRGALAYTTGLSSLGFKDYECVCTHEDLESFVFAFMRSTASGAITRGDQEPDGLLREVDGDDGKRPFEISFRHSTSIRPDGQDVIRLNLQRV